MDEDDVFTHSCFCRIALTMTYFGLSLSSSNLNGNIYLNCFFSAAIDIFAYVFIWLLVERLPRPTLIFCTMMFSGVILLTINLLPEGWSCCDVNHNPQLSCLVQRCFYQ